MVKTWMELTNEHKSGLAFELCKYESSERSQVRKAGSGSTCSRSGNVVAVALAVALAVAVAAAAAVTVAAVVAAAAAASAASARF